MKITSAVLFIVIFFCGCSNTEVKQKSDDAKGCSPCRISEKCIALLAYQSFSPDGCWYVVGCVAPDSPESPYFVATPVVPVDKKHPDFLDTDGLVVLGQVAGMTSVA